MSARTVDWAALRTAPAGAPGAGAGTGVGTGAGTAAESLRERKKRLMRQQLSDTATEMFVERGFDAVRVAEIAEACGVSEKTVFNYFPTKESLLLDRWDSTMPALRTALAEPGVPPVEAVLRILEEEIGGMTSWLAAQEDLSRATASVQRFGRLIRSTASLRAHQRDMAERLVAAAAEVLAERTGAGPEAPEPWIAATALLGLWEVQARSLTRYLDGKRTPEQVRDAVNADVARAARLLDAGLGSFGA